MQTTTLRSNVPLIKISTGTGAISTTAGHPFWVVGQGWKVAKQLSVGMRLHGLDGAVEVTAIEELATGRGLQPRRRRAKLFRGSVQAAGTR